MTAIASPPLVGAGWARLPEYVTAFRAAGLPVFRGSAGCYWVGSAARVVRRVPTIDMSEPSEAEVDEALHVTGALVATFIQEPSDRVPGNAWLYVCRDRGYALRARPSAMQRNVRRALRELRVTELSVGEVLAYGSRAFCDTRRRSELDDGTLQAFRRYFQYGAHRPGRTYLGAWHHGQLAAFLSITQVDDWVELGSFSMSSMLRHRPNDALMYCALSRYAADTRCRVVSYGLSSIQLGGKAAGLHRFKLKVGFEAVPVHRAFVLRRSLRPVVRRATLKLASAGVNVALQLRPRSARLKTLGGLVACMLGDSGLPADGALSPEPVCVV
ncbi:MAG TPA: hypothetical protein VHZ49_22200 [Methylomirabilota bacterium]|nr:hypothetical protein [Methylomirabilota bacterium]